MSNKNDNKKSTVKAVDPIAIMDNQGLPTFIDAQGNEYIYGEVGVLIGTTITNIIIEALVGMADSLLLSEVSSFSMATAIKRLERLLMTKPMEIVQIVGELSGADVMNPKLFKAKFIRQAVLMTLKHPDVIEAVNDYFSDLETVGKELREAYKAPMEILSNLIEKQKAEAENTD